MRTLAVLPVKSFRRAKQRLGSAVADRPALAAAMVGDVLAALRAVPELDGIVVVTAEPFAVEAAEVVGATVVTDREEAGQSAAAALGQRAALAAGAERVLLVPGDCPALDPAEVASLLAHAAGVVIVPDRHGRGTNALLLSPPLVIVPGFGPGSFERHVARARAAGEEAAVADVPSLALDVDTPDDLGALLEALPDRPGRAPRTRALLERLACAAA
jgi:2-phospho-L-lactate/phosphoenolpyruvate guanylyltransferase